MTEVLARKAKQAELEAFKAALPRAHPIFTELEKVGWWDGLVDWVGSWSRQYTRHTIYR